MIKIRFNAALASTLRGKDVVALLASKAALNKGGLFC